MTSKRSGTGGHDVFVDISAPFLGSVAAITFLGEPITVQLILAGLLMGADVWLHLT